MFTLTSTTTPMLVRVNNTIRCILYWTLDGESNQKKGKQAKTNKLI